MSDWLTEAARRSIGEPELPEGLYRRDGRLQFECRVCERWTEWPADPEDFDINAPENVCGGSPRCCIGLNYLSPTPPTGRLIGVVHEEGQDAVEAFCKIYDAELTAMRGVKP